MNPPLVSVVIPTYNRPDCLCELLQSLADQTYKQLEILIVNDHGVSVDFVKALYPELTISIFNLSSNQKHVQARNIGVQHAAGELIMLCDDDDLLLPMHAERMVAEIGDCDLAYSDVEIFQYVKVGSTRIPTARFLFAYEYDLTAMRKFSTFIPSGCVYRKEIHARIGLFDPKVYHYWDWDFLLRAAGRFRVKRVPVASVLYAFLPEGDHLSGNLESMRPYLDLLSRKHKLGELPVKNFLLLLEEPEVVKRRAVSEVLWDGRPVISRLQSLD